MEAEFEVSCGGMEGGGGGGTVTMFVLPHLDKVGGCRARLDCVEETLLVTLNL